MEENIRKINYLIDQYNKSDSKFVLKLYINIKEKTYMTLDQIMDKVCSATNKMPEEVNRNSKKRIDLIPRQMCHYIANKQTKKTLSEIGKHFGNKDHATVLNSTMRIQNYLDTDKEFREKYGELLNSCHS